jgi:hypothetical protein
MGQSQTSTEELASAIYGTPTNAAISPWINLKGKHLLNQT